MSNANSLAGSWAGRYYYPNGLEPVPFDASLIQLGGAISGTITEIATIGWHAGRPLMSTISGGVEGTEVFFTKTYESNDTGYGVVQYHGRVNADATEIRGRWVIGNESAAFVMTRPARVVQTETKKIAEPV